MSGSGEGEMKPSRLVLQAGQEISCRRAVFEESWSRKKGVLVGCVDVRLLAEGCSVKGK
jgi:hypothetical protein